MPITFKCECGRPLRAPDEFAGRKARCPSCGQTLAIPEPGQEPYDDSKPIPLMAEEPPPPPPIERPRPVSRPPSRTAIAVTRREDVADEKPQRTLRDYAYFALLLALVPLLISLVLGGKEDTGERVRRTLEKVAEGNKPAVESGDLDDDAVFAMLPDGRLDGAHLARNTHVHYLYALLAAVGFYGLGLLLAPGGQDLPLRIALVGLFTGTFGILFLFIAQFLAEWTQGGYLISRSPILMLIYYLAFAIGFSYRAALDPTGNFFTSFLGYTFGVGLCEEVCKAVPVIVYYKGDYQPNWRAACALGFASGVGFGVSEAISYSGNYYNGVATFDAYLVRFISCVALHAIWSVSVALFIHAHRSILEGAFEWYEYIPRVIFLVGVPMLLHGLYDTALKKDQQALALLVALASFGWLAWCIERARLAGDADGTQRRRGRRRRAALEGAD